MLHTDTTANILLIEDDEAHAELIRISLENSEFTNSVNHVDDGEKAVHYLLQMPPYEDSVRPDLILLDLNLPKLSGHQVLSRIKTHKDLRTIPVVILTTSNNEKDRKLAYGEYANSYLTKPNDFGEFRQLAHDLQQYWIMWNEKAVQK